MAKRVHRVPMGPHTTLLGKGNALEVREERFAKPAPGDGMQDLPAGMARCARCGTSSRRSTGRPPPRERAFFHLSPNFPAESLATPLSFLVAFLSNMLELLCFLEQIAVRSTENRQLIQSELLDNRYVFTLTLL